MKNLKSGQLPHNLLWNMFKSFFARILHEGVVYAHCDIPCGVYTTHRAGIAAETVEKMVEKITALPDGDTSTETLNTLARMVATKEEWAEICKRELLILWTDYFRDEHLAQFPNLHETFWRATKLCSTNKREVSRDAAKQLRASVDTIADMFEKAEGDKASVYRKNWL
jgi:nickel superoxide dismutase